MGSITERPARRGELRRSRLPRAVLLVALVAGSPLAIGQSQPGPGYAVRLMDGRNDLGQHLALARFGTSDQWLGFQYVADEQSLFSGDCGSRCTPETRHTSGADRGRFVSAARRPTLSNRPFAAYYNATSGDLEALDCFDGSCTFSTIRVLDTVNDVGAGTATAIEPALGNPYVAYYDVTHGDLRLHRCTNAVCDAGSSFIVDGVGDRGRRPSMAFASGFLWIAYEDTTLGEVRIARGTTPYGPADFTTFAVGPGGEPALTVDATGFVDLVYRGGAGNTLERWRCTSFNCTTASQETLDGAGRGHSPSATRMPNGNLLVSHHQPGTGAMLATVCDSPVCGAPLRVTLEAGPGFGPQSVATAYSNNRPLVHYRDATRAELRSTQCSTAACTVLIRRIVNGIPAFAPNLALRADGRPVAIWTRLRRPVIGVCTDASCTSFARRLPEAGNSDMSRPAIAIRPDGRPFAYYSYFGGTTAWDCADVECSTGVRRDVSGTANFTSNVTELAIRPDGRPVMLYANSLTNEVFLYDCANVGCSSGQARLLDDDADQNVQSTQLSNFALAIGGDGRPAAAWTRLSEPTPGNFAGALRFARCDDLACTSVTLRSLNAEQSFLGGLAIRTDNRPVLLEGVQQVRNLATCDDATCASLARVAVPNLFDAINQLVLRPGNLPAYNSGTIGNGGWWQCGDPACSNPERFVAITDTTTNMRGHLGPIAFGAGPRPVGLYHEQDLQDIWLAVPLPEAIFANGFEP
jgi:hypothetical protein